MLEGASISFILKIVVDYDLGSTYYYLDTGKFKKESKKLFLGSHSLPLPFANINQIHYNVLWN